MTTLIMLVILMVCLMLGVLLAMALGFAAALVALLRVRWVRIAAVAVVAGLTLMQLAPQIASPWPAVRAMAQVQPDPESSPATSIPPDADAPDEATSADEAAKLLLAGTYPSLESAQYGLTRHFRPIIESHQQAVSRLKPVLVYGPVQQGLLHDIVRRFEEVGLKVPMTRGANKDYINPDDQVSLRVTLDEADPRLMPLERPLPLSAVKTLRMMLYVPGQEVVAQGVYVVDEPWVEDLKGWQTRQHRLDRLYLVGFSDVLTPTQEAAEDSAIERLVAQLSMSSSAQQSTTGMTALTEPLVLARAIRAYMTSVEELGLPRSYEWYIQWFDRPYGRVWRAALLMDTSPEAMAHVEPFLRQSRQVSTSAHQEAQRSHRTGWLSVSLLIALLLVAYAFVNSTTQGYYVWPLRIGALALLAVLLVMLIA